MKMRVFSAILAIAAATAGIIAFANDHAAQAGNSPAVKYSTSGHGPSIILLHDQSAEDRNWVSTAKDLASSFKVTLVDISQFESDANALSKMSQLLSQLPTPVAGISGSRHGESLALALAQNDPQFGRGFQLPHESGDLEIVTTFFTSTTL